MDRDSIKQAAAMVLTHQATIAAAQQHVAALSSQLTAAVADACGKICKELVGNRSTCSVSAGGGPHDWRLRVKVQLHSANDIKFVQKLTAVIYERTGINPEVSHGG